MSQDDENKIYVPRRPPVFIRITPQRRNRSAQPANVLRSPRMNYDIQGSRATRRPRDLAAEDEDESRIRYTMDEIDAMAAEQNIVLQAQARRRRETKYDEGEDEDPNPLVDLGIREEKKGGFSYDELKERGLINRMDIDADVYPPLTARESRTLQKEIQVFNAYNVDLQPCWDWRNGSAWPGIPLTNMPNGANIGERIGNSVQGHSLEFRFQIQQRINDNDFIMPASTVRIMLVVDKMRHDPNGENIADRLFGTGVGGTPQDIYLAGKSVLLPFIEGYKEQFQILRDELFDMPACRLDEHTNTPQAVSTVTVGTQQLATTGTQTQHSYTYSPTTTITGYWHVPLKSMRLEYKDNSANPSAALKNAIYLLVFSTLPFAIGNVGPRLYLTYTNQLKYNDT